WPVEIQPVARRDPAPSRAAATARRRLPERATATMASATNSPVSRPEPTTAHPSNPYSPRTAAATTATAAPARTARDSRSMPEG
ncbi:MAG: hypothetical protein AVDCRST_MAG10-294, partial [uncultured Acidimicrobiales bacterium]